jgi:carbamoyltransferase
LPIFVPVNPNDCGLSFGFLTAMEPPVKNKVTISYNGYGILDIDNLFEYRSRYGAEMTTISALAELLTQGNIIGIVTGRSEVGARALGNRSILCDPSFEGMKDRINALKQRESYRPFAPVVKAEDASKYFHFDGESEFMSYAPLFKEEYLKKVPSVVHKDGTGRLQTVTQRQNWFLYNLIDAVEMKTGIGILLNTSFNIKGKPILTPYPMHWKY